MTRYRSHIIDDFEDHAAGEIVANQSGSTWAAEAADDNLAIVVAGSLLVETNCLRILDQSNTDQASVTKTLPFTISTGDIARIGAIKPVTAVLESSYLDMKYREAASVIVWLRLRLDNGIVYYSTDSGATFTTTGITLALDTINYKLDVEFTSASTFKVRLNSGAWTAALTNDNNYTAGITKCEFTTPAAHGFEGFESYAVGASTPKNTAYWNNWNANGNGDLEVITGKKTQMTKSNGAAWTLAPIMTFGTAGGAAAGGYVQFDINFSSLPSGDWMNLYVREAGAASRLSFCVRSTGALQVLADGTYTNVGVTLVASTSYTVRITTATIDAAGDASYVTVNSTQYGPWYNVSKRTGALVDMHLISNATVNNIYTLDNIITSWATAAPDVDDIDVYIDDLWGLELSTQDESLTVFRPVLVAENAADQGYPAGLGAEYVDTGTYVVFSSNGGISRMTEATGAVTLVKENPSHYYRMCSNGSTTIYAVLLHHNINMQGTLVYSTDSGGTWNDVAAAGTDRYALGIAYVNSTVEVLCAWLDGDGHTNFNAWEWTSGGGWVNEANQDTGGHAPVGGLVTNIHMSNGYVSGTDWYFATSVLGAAGHVEWEKLDKTANTLTDVSEVCATPSIAGYNGENALVIGTTIVMSTYVTLPAEYCLYKSTDSGLSWAKTASVSNYFLFPRKEELGTRYFGIENSAANSNIYEWSSNTNHLSWLFNVANFDDSVAGITDLAMAPTKNDFILAKGGTNGCTVYHLEKVPATEAHVINAIGSPSIVTATSLANAVEFQTTIAHAAEYSKGQMVEFYDAWDTLWFKGRVVDSVLGSGVATFTVQDSTREIGRYYDADFTAQKASAMISMIVNTFTDGYSSSFEDTNYAGTFDYDMKSAVHTDLNKFLRMYRAMERAVVWVTPAGAWNANHHDGCTATGYRLHYKASGNNGCGVQLIDAITMDARVTRASVSWSSTRTTVTGNAAREVTEGVVQCEELNDDAIVLAADATDLATQLYNIFSTSTTFVHLLLTGYGAWQPGKTIDFSWDLGGTTVARASLIIIAAHQYMLQDMTELVLSNNIVLEAEHANLGLADR